MMKEIENLITESLKELGLETVKFSVEHPTDLKMGDYSTNVGIVTGKAKEIVEVLKKTRPNFEIELAGPGFINFRLPKEFFAESLKEIKDKGEKFGQGKHAKGYKVMVEHTQPNPFKAFHIGHLMNNAIGESIARIIKANGAEVKTASYHGDIGMHVAKALWKGDYAIGAKAFEEDVEAKAEIQAINKKVYEQSDPELNQRYKEGREKSLAAFEQMYERLGSQFDYHFFESESGEIGKKIVEENIGKVFEESDRAIVYKGEKVGLHTRVFLNSEKLPTYEAKEIGLAQMKSEKFAFDNSLTITGNEQDAFFQVVESAIGEVFPNLKGKMEHKGHGMLRLPTGKMSSRTGDVITAEELIETVKEKVKGDEQVAVGAIKYMILRQGIGQDIIFDIEKSVSTEGDSGVYLQYAHARASSLLEKAGKEGDTTGGRANTHEIEKLLYRFPEIVERAGKEYAPNFLVTYLTLLASSFNNFYAHEPVLEEGPESSYRLAIVEAFKIVMQNGLNILGIPAPERM